MKCNRQCFAVPWFLQFHQTLHFRAREQVTVGGPPHFSIPQEDHSWQSRRCRPMEVIFRSSKVLSKYSQTNLHSYASRHVPFPVLTIPNMVGRKLCLKPSKASKRIPSEADGKYVYNKALIHLSRKNPFNLVHICKKTSDVSNWFSCSKSIA